MSLFPASSRWPLDRVLFWVAFAAVAFIIATALGCATLAEQDQQRQEIIELQWRVDRLEASRWIKMQAFRKQFPLSDEIRISTEEP